MDESGFSDTMLDKSAEHFTEAERTRNNEVFKKTIARSLVKENGRETVV